jgi:hypothetical protein
MEGYLRPMERKTPKGGSARPEGVALHDLLALGGLGIVHLMVAPCGLAARVTDVVVHDPVARGTLSRGCLVAAVGVHPKGLDALALLDGAAQAGAVALLFAGDDDVVTEELVDHADRLGIALLRVGVDVVWAKLLVALHGALAGEDSAAHAVPSVGIGDLFDLANAVAGLMGGAVAIEDPRGRLLAHSTSGEPIDEVRRETILQRHTPTTLSRHLVETGVYRRLWRGEVVRHQSSDIPRCAPRLGVAVRTPDEVLGVIWVLEGANTFGDEAEAAMRRVSEAAVVHFLRHRADLEPVRLARGEHLRTLLSGSGNPEVLARELDLDPHAAALVVLVAIDSDDDTLMRVVRDRMAGITELHFQALRRQSMCVVLDDGLYALVPDDPPTPSSAMQRATEDLVQRLRSIFRVPVRAAVGHRAPRLDELPDARSSAVLAMRAAPPDLAVVDAGAFSNQVLLLGLHQAVTTRLEMHTSKVAALRAHDEQRGSELVPTLRAYLDAFGDIVGAANRIGIHPNTLRYRLHRMTQVADVDLDDPDERLVLALELRLD